MQGEHARLRTRVVSLGCLFTPMRCVLQWNLQQLILGLMPPQLQAPQLEAVEDVVFPICGKCAQPGEGWQFPSCGPQCSKVAAPPPPGYPAGPPPPPYEPEVGLHRDQAFIIPDKQNVVKFGLGWSCARNFDMDAAVLLLGNSPAPPSYDQPRPRFDAKGVAEKLGMYIICREIGEPASAVGESF